MIGIRREALSAVVRGFRGKRVLVLGDLMLDRYIWGGVSRISPEAPVPVVAVHAETSCLGGAGNVGHNLESLGARPFLVGLVGKDEAGRWIRDQIADRRGIFVDEKRPTTVKTRIIAHHQQVVRVDKEQRAKLSPDLEKRILAGIAAAPCKGIVISDYDKGLLTATLVPAVLALARARRIPVFVDPKVERFPLYTPVTLITPNHHEAELVVGHPCRTDAQVEKAGEEILDRVSARYLILKRGEQGMTVFERGKRPIHIPTNAQEVFDVTGAGDTVIATAALALLAGANIREAAVLANAAAAIVVGKIGTATATAAELLAAVTQQQKRKRP
ncbi:MAG: D-glycero-beta-D-manno-heptose-7-phosphate kinase [Candidatus Aminicenantes bacterium]|nr:D-glycero-beta-D-manno-heptose-7-phosphate kinase [Candidatus Aminicenantes bacterium]